ncbi:hypothetical protein WJX84_004031 [Apatococcus fuscideae]|uniref:Uncharacterized protein n=1 Tax=Apatococcus fuscideae TaxID=2026836 RepID=A0AAW1T0E0_9CHLO
MPFFGYGERFKEAKEHTPGPGDYDPSKARGYKVDPKSGFIGKDRFSESEREEGERLEFSPPRERRNMPPAGMNDAGRKFSWATQRIHELEKELDACRNRIKELRATVDSEREEFQNVAAVQHELIQKYDKEQKRLEAALEEAKASVAGLTAQQQDLQSTAEKAASASTSAQTQLTSLQQAFQQLQKTHAEQHEELADKVNRLSEATDETGKLQELHAASSSKTARLEAELSSVKRHCTETVKELQQRTANNDTLQGELTARRGQLDSKARETATLNSKVELLQEEVESMTRQVASLIMRLAQQRQETDAEKREAESALAHHLEEMQEHVANLTQRMHADQAENAELKRQTAELNAHLAAEQSKARADTEASAQQASRLSADLQAAQEQGREAEANEAAKSMSQLRSKHDDLAEQLGASEARGQSLELELGSLRRQVAAAEERHRQLEAAHQETQQLCADLEALKQDLNASQSKLMTENSTLSSERSELQETAALLSTRSNDLQASLAELETEAQAAHVAHLKSAVTESSLELSKIQGKHTDLHSQHSKLQQQISTLNDEHAHLGKALADLESRNATVEKERGTLEEKDSHTALSQTHQSAQDSLEACQVDLAELQKQHAELDTSKQGLEVARQQLEQSLAAMEKSKSEIEAQCGILEQKLTVLNEAKRSLHEDLEGLRDKAGLNHELLDIQDAQRKLQSEHEELLSEHANLQTHLDASKSSSAVLEKQLAALMRLTQEHSVLIQQKQDAQDTVSKLEEQAEAQAEAYTESLAARDSAIADMRSGDEKRLQAIKFLQADLESMSQQRSDSDAAGAELMAHLEEAETRTLAAEEAAQAASQEAASAKQRLDDLQVGSSDITAKLQEERAAAAGVRDQAREIELQATKEEIEQLYRALEIADGRVAKAEQQAASAHERGAQEKMAELQEQIEAVGKESQRHIELSDKRKMLKSELRRLEDENSMQRDRITQMEHDLKELLNTKELGHNNPKQKIQYHLRLKQELEEMRSQCMLFLRERYYLEQCVRYLAAKTTIPQHAAQDFGGQTRSPLEKMPIQPKSMVQHPAYMTPVGRRSLALAGRGRRAAEDGGPIWQPKAEIQAAIESAVAQTQGSLDQLLAQAAANEGHAVTEDGQFSDENSPLPGGKQSGPPAFDRSPSRGHHAAPEGPLSPSKTPQQPLTETGLQVFNAAHDDNTDVIRAHHGSVEGDAPAAAPGMPGDLGTPGRPASPMPRRLTTTAEDANALEMRIVNKIVDIVSPRKRGRTLRLLQGIEGSPVTDAKRMLHQLPEISNASSEASFAVGGTTGASSRAASSIGRSILRPGSAANQWR